MKKRLLRILCTSIGIFILMMCITGEVDGIGRFAMIVFGAGFAYIGACIK